MKSQECVELPAPQHWPDSGTLEIHCLAKVALFSLRWNLSSFHTLFPFSDCSLQILWFSLCTYYWAGYVWVSGSFFTSGTCLLHSMVLPGFLPRVTCVRKCLVLCVLAADHCHSGPHFPSWCTDLWSSGHNICFAHTASVFVVQPSVLSRPSSVLSFWTSNLSMSVVGQVLVSVGL